jgi:CTP:molybdopterin cytidylyltransferase MocA
MSAHPHPSAPGILPWSAVLLAAGEGRRLGGVAKALIRIQGQTLLARQLALLHAAGAHQVVVVTSPAHHAAIAAEASAFAQSLRSPAAPSTRAPGPASAGAEPPPPKATTTHTFAIQLVCNTAAALGQGGSVRCGLAALLATAQPEVDAPARQPIAMLLIDLPLLTAHDLTPLLHTWHHTPHPGCLVPCHQGQRGHPVLLSHAMARDVLQQPAPLAVREHLQRHPEQLTLTDVDHNHGTTDLDTPEQCAELARRTGWHLVMPD